MFPEGIFKGKRLSSIESSVKARIWKLSICSVDVRENYLGHIGKRHEENCWDNIQTFDLLGKIRKAGSPFLLCHVVKG